MKGGEKRWRNQMAIAQVETVAVKAETEQAVKARGQQAGRAKPENLLVAAGIMLHLKRVNSD